MLYLYDPRTNILTETSYTQLEELTGKSYGALVSLKFKKYKINTINCYICDDKITTEQRKEWYQKEKYNDEVWKQINGSQGNYYISNYGRVKRVWKTRTNILLPYPRKRRSGRLAIKVMYNGRYNEYDIAQLVAAHFLEAPQPNQVLHHKNLIVTDNFTGNLAYITRRELGKKTARISNKTPVVKLDIDTLEVLDEYRSAREAGRQCYLSYQAILDNCHHKSKTSGGFIFMFLDEHERLFGEVIEENEYVEVN